MYTPGTEDMGPMVTVPLLFTAFNPIIYILYATVGATTVYHGKVHRGWDKQISVILLGGFIT